MIKHCLSKEPVEILGLYDPERVPNIEQDNWTQISIPETIIIPEQKPDIEQLETLSISVNILRKKVILTPVSTVPNEEGKNLTGYKLIIEGELNQEITYVADVAEQSVHTAHFMIPFSAFIIIPAPVPVVPVDQIHYNVEAYVEDVFITSVCKRQIFKNITLLLRAVEDECSCNEDAC